MKNYVRLGLVLLFITACSTEEVIKQQVQNEEVTESNNINKLLTNTDEIPLRKGVLQANSQIIGALCYNPAYITELNGMMNPLDHTISMATFFNTASPELISDYRQLVGEYVNVQVIFTSPSPTEPNPIRKPIPKETIGGKSTNHRPFMDDIVMFSYAYGRPFTPNQLSLWHQMGHYPTDNNWPVWTGDQTDAFINLLITQKCTELYFPNGVLLSNMNSLYAVGHPMINVNYSYAHQLDRARYFGQHIWLNWQVTNAYVDNTTVLSGAAVIVSRPQKGANTIICNSLPVGFNTDDFLD